MLTKVGAIVHHSGLSFFLASDPVTINPWIYYVGYPVMGGLVLAAAKGIAVIYSRRRGDRLLEQKSSRELLLDMSVKFFGREKTKYMEKVPGWIEEVELQFKEMRDRMGKLEHSQSDVIMALNSKGGA